MKRFFALFVWLNICSLMTGCTIFYDVLTTPDAKFLDSNTVGGFGLLVDIGRMYDPYDFTFTPSGWRILACHSATRDTIIYRTEKVSTKYLVSFPPHMKYDSTYHRIDHLMEIQGKLYLTGLATYSGTIKSYVSLFAFDTLTKQAEALATDSLLGLAYRRHDSASIYFSSGSDGIFRFDLADKSLSSVSTAPPGAGDASHYLNGYLLSIASDSICMTDTAGHSALWKTGLRSPDSSRAKYSTSITDIMIRDGSIYACGSEAHANGEYSCGSLYGIAAKLDKNGKILWRSVYDRNSAQSEFQKLADEPSGDILCIGSMRPCTGNDYFYVLRIDKDGNLKTQKIVSNNSGSQSSMSGFQISNIVKVEANIVHIMLEGYTLNREENYYGQISY